ncbi:branched-chain amino acid ABC transporter permease [Microbacterium sp. STN6]|uniref:branched-chain amino acid ABC transporter permease n=1 Tax=Microbacterium sp. STN6 TaxID=2995588 RepID=UPI002260D5B9|nr:branched-chain amino acid ABC transporter permease [Microbacterium sp. STN6]MCX7523302.1 branched-chain amino acid ABC transporter permease [Microbacterium sp. STN6]
MTRRIPALVVCVAAVIALVVPLFLPDLSFYIQMILAAVIVTGLSLFMGYAGQASLGHGAFVAVGALTVAVMTVRLGLPPLLALICAPILAAVFAYIVGLPLLRLRGHYLAFGTLALLLIVQAVIATVPFFGGGLGIFGVPPLGVGDAVISGQLPYVYLSLAVLALALLISRNVIRSRFGRGVRALAGSESAAASSGVPVLRTKLAVFALSAAFAGLAGGIMAFFTPYVSSESFPVATSIAYIIMAVIGGLGSLWGGVIGAVLVSLLVQVLNAVSNQPGLPATTGPVLQYGAYALVLILALLFIPKGIVPTIAQAMRRRRDRRADAAAPTDVAVEPWASVQG